MGIKYDDIKKANDATTTTDIKGKDYVEVNQRIKAFRMVYPDGFIHTKMKSNDKGVCIFKAECGFFAEDGTHRVLGTGTAYEKEGSNFINSTSYIENCETSAVGRALGMAGFGINESVASYEEVANAKANQGGSATGAGRKASQKQIAVLAKVYKGDLLTKLLEKNGLKKLEDISMEKASELISKLKEKENEHD